MLVETKVIELVSGINEIMA